MTDAFHITDHFWEESVSQWSFPLANCQWRVDAMTICYVIAMLGLMSYIALSFNLLVKMEEKNEDPLDRKGEYKPHCAKN